MTKFKYVITFKDGTYTETIAEKWIGRDDWIIFLIDEQEILRVVTSEIRMIERRKP
jgi:hypothetical protein